MGEPSSRQTLLPDQFQLRSLRHVVGIDEFWTVLAHQPALVIRNAARGHPVHDKVLVNAVTEVNAKGKTIPIKVYEVLGLR